VWRFLTLLTGGGTNNSDLQPGDGCADQLSGQVLPGAVRDHQVSSRQRREGFADHSSGGEIDHAVLQGVDSLQDGGISVKVLNPAMGVPISFLDKYCPEQFEILGCSDNGAVNEIMKLQHFKRHNEPYVADKKTYKRIFIRYISSVA
jgi:hypothetical protein